MSRVLLVDDNEAITARAERVIAQEWTVVGIARDARGALESAARLQPDVIVLDISLPGMSGIELACALRRAGSTAAFVFLTVHEEQEFVAAAQAAGAVGYVIKSRLGSDLPAALREAAAGRPFTSPFRGSGGQADQPRHDGAEKI